MKSMHKRISEEEISNRFDEYMREGAELIDKFSKREDLELKNGVLESIFESNPRKAVAIAMMLENTQKEMRRMDEYQTSDAFGVFPTDIVKVYRYAYTNSVMFDLFDVWGMSSLKDSFYKIETQFGSTARGATQGNTTYENTTDGRYPTAFEQAEITGDGSADYTGTLSVKPIKAYQVKIYLDGDQIAVDDGAGNLVGSGLSDATASTLNYTTGEYDITLSSTITSASTILIEYGYDVEDSTLFGRQGTVQLNVVPFDFHAQFSSLGVSWHAMAQEVLESKANVSAKDTLIASASDVMKKAFDEYGLTMAYRASNWDSAVTFDTDYSAYGNDNDESRAQQLMTAVGKAENKAYNALERYAGKYNLVAGPDAILYAKKHKLYKPESSVNRVGIFKVGELDGRGLYQAPASIVPTDEILSIGKSASDSMSTDSVVSIGTWKGQVKTKPIEYKNFQSEMGLGAFMDVKTNEKKFASRVKLTNLS